MNLNLFSSQPAWWQRARAQGLVSGDAPNASIDEDPNIFVVVLALIGALVCTLLVGAFLFALLDSDFWFRNPAAVGVSVLGIVGAGVMLHRARGVFITCLALVLWGTFIALLLLRIGDQIDHDERQLFMLCSGLVFVLQLAGAFVARALWIKRIMGFVCAVALHWFLATVMSSSLLLVVFDVSSLLMVACWLFFIRKEPGLLAARGASLTGWAVFLDSVAVALIGMMALNYVDAGLGVGLSHKLQGLWGTDVTDMPESTLRLIATAGRVWAVALVLLATGLVHAHWKRGGMAQPQTLMTLLGTGVLLAVAAWFAPSLGMLALMAAGALIGGRWRIAALCGVAALWALSQFYYSLAWTLAQKGLGLALFGALLLVGLYLQRLLAAHKAAVDAGAQADAMLPPLAAWSRTRLLCLIAGALLIFGLVNWDVRGKEQVIEHGQPVLVRLVPVDPRSLMQGDYMALRFDLPAEVREGLENTLAPAALVEASLDDKGRATVLGLARPNAALGQGRILLPLKRLKGSWVLVTDAFFFPEGQGRVFEHASYGDFRVLPDGRALLVGLADADGQAIEMPRGPRVPLEEETEAMEESAAVAPVAPDVAPAVPEAEPAAPTGRK